MSKPIQDNSCLLTHIYLSEQILLCRLNEQVRGTTRCVVSRMKSIYFAKSNTGSRESRESRNSRESRESREM